MDYRNHAKTIRGFLNKYIKRYGKDKDYNQVERLIEKCALLCEFIADNEVSDPKKSIVAVMEFELPWNQLSKILKRKYQAAVEALRQKQKEQPSNE